jgi:L-aspartate oxidase
MKPPPHDFDMQDLRNSLRSLVWRRAGLERSAEGLAEAAASVAAWGRYTLLADFTDVPVWELQNMLSVAQLVLRFAARREESRGVHYRTDFPERDDRWRCRQRTRRGGPIREEPVA